MATPKLNFKFLKDEPKSSKSVSYKGFYHSSVAPALKEILKDESSPHTIGLFGAWGTGKSTIIEMVQNDKGLGLPVFIFDAWKYQEDTLRRTFLIKLVDFLNVQGYKLPEDILVNLYSSKTSSIAKQRKVESDTATRSKVWVFIKKYMPFVGIVLALIAASILVAIYPNYVASQIILQVVSIATGISFLALFGKPIVEGVLKIVIESFFAKQEQQTELITELHQEDRLNSPEQFEEKFIEILSHVKKKLVIVFDNIDRVQGDVAISMLSTIKTFMYSGSGNGLVFLVPCDPSAIEVQVEKYFYGNKLENHNDSFGAAEYLRKIFNLIIWIPDFINTDLEEYTKALIKDTGEISKLLIDEDVVLVINSAFSKNPREIIQFINNLIAMIITIQGTGVKDIVNMHIAYLAKILVLRQRFPKAYERLKTTWHHPEDITGKEADKDHDELVNFMNKTSRITVDDAEPYIYFKDPAVSRGLSAANEIKNALFTASTTEAIEVSTDEPHDKLIEFIADLIGKYSGQDDVLFNVVVTQFEVVKALGVDVSSKKYVNDLAKTIDSELWGKYTSLPLEHVFELLTNRQLNLSLKNNILERYITSLETDDGITDFKRSVLSSLRNNSTILTKQHRQKIRSILESRYGTDEEALSLFDTPGVQEAFITEKLITDYIASFDFANLTTKLNTLSAYKKYVIKHSLIPDIVSAISTLLKQDITATSSYNENKAYVISAIDQLAQTFGSELKNGSSYLTELTQDIIKTFPYTSTWEEQADEVNALYWIRGYVDATEKPNVISIIRNYFQSISNLEQFKKPIDYWNKESKARFISLILPAIYPRLATSDDVLRYVYEHASKEDQSAIISDLIDRVPLDNPYDINFISTLQAIPDRKDSIAKLLEKAGKVTYTHKAKYYDYIAEKILKSDPPQLKNTALDQIKTLLKSNSAAQGEVGYDFFNNLVFVQDSDRRRLALEIVEWLREPGRVITTEHRVAIQVVNDSFELLQDTPKKDFIYLIFSLLSESGDAPTTQMLTGSLQTVHPTYRAYRKDFDDLLTRMQNWTDTQAKQIVHDALPSLASSKPSKTEATYWESIKALYPQEESMPQ